MQIVSAHALPNSIAPTIQVIGLNFPRAYGVVVVEFVFNFPASARARLRGRTATSR